MSTDLAKPGGSLERRAARGAFVTTGGQLARLVIQTGGIVILARLLTPEDYGLIAMVGVIVTLGEIFREFGLGAAAIQAPTISSAQRNNLFWANVGLGFLLFLVTQALAVPLASFFSQPEVVEIARVMAVVFIINGASSQYRAQLTRHMRFKALIVPDLIGQVLGLAAGVAASLAGWGYWSLVVMQVGQAVVTLVLLVVAGRWLPSRYDRSADMKPFWRFGVHMLGSQLVAYGGNNADTMVLGYRLGPAELGLYDRAYRLVMVPLAQMRAPTTTVAIPLFSRLADDRVRFDRALLAGQLALGYVLVPIVLLIASASEPIVNLALGDQWQAVSPIMAFLAIAGALQLLSYVGYWVYVSRGLTKDLFQYSIISACVRILCILIGSNWGSIGVAAGVAVAMALLWPVSLWWLSRRTEIPVRKIVQGALRILGMAAAAGLAAWATVELVAGSVPDLVAIAVAGAVMVAVYAIGFLLPLIRRDELTVLRIMRMMLGQRFGSVGR